MMGDNSSNFEQHSDLIVTDTSAPGFGVLKADDGIDYLRDVDVAIRDVINLFRNTLRTLERRLSRKSDTEFLIEVPSTASAAESFLDKLRFLIEHTEARINVSPNRQQEQERKLRHAVRSCGRTEMDMESLKDSLRVQRTEHRKSAQKINKELEYCLESSRMRAGEIENEIKRIVNESEIKMSEFYKQAVAKEELLRSEIKFLKTRLNDLRRNNILMEKELGDKRCKVENQLLDFVAKYDEEIGGRHRDMENLAKEYELLYSQRKMLEDDVMVNLRTIHDDLQKEKAEALKKILNQRVEKFVRNRAARVIQKAWRAYWERHCAKKKKKSRKK